MKFLGILLGVLLGTLVVSAQGPILRNQFTTNTSTAGNSALVRTTAGGAPAPVTIGTGLAFDGTTLTGTGTNAAALFVNGTNVASPNLTNNTTLLWGVTSSNITAFPTNLGVAQFANTVATNLGLLAWTNNWTGTQTFTVIPIVPNDSFALGTKTTGSYAAGDAEAGNASTVVVVDSTDATSFIAIFDSATGGLPVKTDGALLYNASNGTLTTTTFAGAGGGITLVATGFDGNLTTSDDTLQEIAQKLDDLVITGGGGTNGTAQFVNGVNASPINLTNTATITWATANTTNASASVITVPVVDSTDATSSIAMFDSATGNLAPKTDAGLTYNATTGVLTATGFSGPLTGAVTGNADTATLAATSTVIDSTDATSFVAIFDSATGSLPIKTDGALLYNASNGTLTTTTFSGALSGNASTATLAATSTVVDGTDSTSFVAIFDSATGSLAIKTDGALLYDASNGTLTASQFVGGGAGITGVTASPGGSTTEVQYNNAGTMDGASGITVGAETNLTVTGTLQVGASTGSPIIQIGNAGVQMTDDGDGALILLGLGNGSDEDLNLNLDDTANNWIFSSSTGVTNAGFTAIGLTAISFTGPLIGNASTATLASTSTVVDSTDATSFIAMFDSATGSLAVKTDGGLLYDATTANLTATTFTGALAGNATTATTATLASTVTVVDSTDATSFVGIYDSATGSLAPKTDGALLYDASNGTLTATTIAGAGGGITLVATGFDGNLTTSDNTLQEIAQKLDDLVITGTGDAVLIDGVAVADASGVNFIGGLGIDFTFNAGVSPDTATAVLDLTELQGGATVGDGTSDSWVLTANISAADPTLSFVNDGSVQISQGTAGAALLRLSEDTDNGTQFATLAAPASIATTFTNTLQALDGTIALTANNLSVFAATTSAQLSGVLSDENGTGPFVLSSASIQTNATFAASVTNTFLTASQAVFTGANKELVSVAATGSGNVMRTRVGVVRSMAVPMGAWYTNNINGSLATLVSFTNVGDAYGFSDGATNTANLTLPMPLTWDVGTLKLQFSMSTATTNTTSNTNVVFSIRAASVGDAQSWNPLTFGTAILFTNHIHKAAWTNNVCVTPAITVGNTPAVNKPIVFELSRITTDSTDVNTNRIDVIMSQIFYTETATEPAMPATTQ